MRTNHNRHNARTHSLAKPTVFTAPADAPKKDTRGKTNNDGRSGNGTCIECGAALSLRKVTQHFPSRTATLPLGTPVVVNHRPGGGRYSMMRGDALCVGSAMLPKRVQSDG